MTKHQKILNHLARMAQEIEPVAAARITAALVYKREILAYGLCKMKSHPFQKTYGKSDKAIMLHAEVDCIKNAINDKIDLDILAKSTLLVMRQRIINGKFTNGLAKPCCGCQRCIATFGIRKVIYSLNDEGHEIL